MTFLTLLFYLSLATFCIGLLFRDTRRGGWIVLISLGVLLALAILYGDQAVGEWLGRHMAPGDSL